MSEWIEHDGKGMPVGRKTRVFVKHRNGETHEGFDFAGMWDLDPSRWRWTWDELDIVAYRIVEQSDV